MERKSFVTIARGLEVDEIVTDGSFDHTLIVDLRSCERGNARPVEEAVLKRLRNHFIGYHQVPTCVADASHAQHKELANLIKANNRKLMVVTDDIGSLAQLCEESDIPFVSKTFYVVETGKGDMIKPVLETDAAIARQYASAAI